MTCFSYCYQQQLAIALYNLALSVAITQQTYLQAWQYVDLWTYRCEMTHHIQHLLSGEELWVL